MADVYALLATIPRPEAPCRVQGSIRFGRLVLGVLAVVAALLARGRFGPALDVALDRVFSGWGVLGLFVVLYVVGLVSQRRQRVLLLENNEAMILPAANRLAEAEDRYDVLVQRAPRGSMLHALFVGNRGAVAFHQGQLERARLLLAESLRSGHFTQGEADATGAYFAAMLGRVHVQLELLEDAASWRELARALAPPSRSALVRLLDAALLLRQGRYAEAAQQIASGWMGSEGELSAHERRHLRALHAFALAQLPGHDEDCQRVLAALHPPMPELLAAVCAGWPEMERFLRAHQLLP